MARWAAHGLKLRNFKTKPKPLIFHDLENQSMVTKKIFYDNDPDCQIDENPDRNDTKQFLIITDKEFGWNFTILGRVLALIKLKFFGNFSPRTIYLFPDNLHVVISFPR